MDFSDQLQKFTFQNSDVRGELIHLDRCYRTVLEKAHYPDPVARMLGQFLAAAGLLSGTLKFEGVLNIQARGDGALRLMMADCTRQHLLRGIARLATDPGTGSTAVPGDAFGEWLGRGQLAITIDPAKGSRYQGLVPLEQTDFAACLETYFELSEQLPTRLWLASDKERVGGLLLQALPVNLQSKATRNQQWQEIACLADTLKDDELLELSPRNLLKRLFHHQTLRLFAPRPMAFGCSCSEQRTGEVLRSLGREEALAIVEEQGLISIDCQFCGQQYRFSGPAVMALFANKPPVLH